MNAFEQLTREELVALAQQLAQQIADLEKQVEALRAQLPGGGKGNGLPPFVKLNREQRRVQQPRKKRTQSFVRKREKPTEEIPHVVETCPDCGRKLEGGWEHGRRQVIEVPKTPVRIIDHVLVARRCGICGKIHIPKLGPEDGVVGQHRVGVGLMGLVATLSAEYRMPQASIQGLLQSQYGLHVSVGEVSGILQTVAKRGQSVVDGILEQIRTAPVVHGDETGWREDGVNGYLWSFSTPLARFFYRDKSRAGEIARKILSETFAGVLVTDFYSAYSWYLGRAQRCWPHFIRDLKALRDDHKETPSVGAWVEQVFSIYGRAKVAAAGDHLAEERRRWRCRFEAELLAVAKPFLSDKDAPQHTLAKRVEQFQSQLFTFVEHSGVPSDNNAAERALRPAVIARKVSGGTRSAKGSDTKAALLTLFGTWKLRGLDQLQACIEMLTAPQAAARAAPA